ncbi:hypothetical protein DDZ13_03290 [Coraliomargarita sinensis]|uniref:Outer membrane lipoprotein-sorting protein n=2 Tax=Coraliomargarita sinensis TaxID=2174842 RepID=A0A317ZH63_9BACT|nr:hypothetical protein DDZ13_03290 [Coraliomargarita sinensis]
MCYRLPLCFASFLLILCSLATLSAQQTPPDPETAKKARPDTTDAASRQLIQNYLTVTGGADAHDTLRNVLARGSLTEAGRVKEFELIELQDGKRHLTLTWRHLGRDYKELFVFDGLKAWRQEVRPEMKDPEDYSGQEAIHFSNQRWLLQPFVLPTVADYTFQYQGAAKVGGRPCHVVVGYGKKDERSWFYFDQEKFLVLRWGGFGELAGVREYMDYRASKFKKTGGVLLPSEIDLLAENAAFGRIKFEEILPNQTIDQQIFNKPRNRTPVLRQRTTSRN